MLGAVEAREVPAHTEAMLVDIDPWIRVQLLEANAAFRRVARVCGVSGSEAVAAALQALQLQERGPFGLPAAASLPHDL